MTYTETIQFLYDLRWFGAKLGLENTFRLARLAGNPQEKLRFIHVAGTNGKGSTCAMLESIYRAAGLRVGLFTSPHLVSFRERIQVNRELISEADVVRLVDELREQSLEFRLQAFPEPAEAGTPNKEEDRQDTCPTFFEFITVMALKYFAEQRCDLVIWETGLGGRLDATNIVIPLASVITNISFDHERWLGHTLAEIAREKAGIIKPGVPVVTATDAPEALAVIQETAARLKAPLTLVGQPPTPDPSQEGNRVTCRRDTSLPYVGGVGGGFVINVALPLLGDHQRFNAALAAATVRVLQNEIPISEEAICTGLETVQWPGRLQVVKRDNQTLLLDGAHNPAGVETLRAALEKYFPDERPAMILGCLADKDWLTMCHTLAPLADQIFLAPVQSMRTASPAELADVCQRENPSARVEACATLTDALQKTAATPFVVITGSLHFIGEAMELLQVSAVSAQDERGLNEWQLAPTQQHAVR
jgi:dihydrofolate synthase / folylpolyglutamate synthase